MQNFKLGRRVQQIANERWLYNTGKILRGTLNSFRKIIYTGWPRKNATTLIVNFKNIIDETELLFILFGTSFIFQQNDTMIEYIYQR